jgi:enoyl-CoA hydratase/carnithine racemase
VLVEYCHPRPDHRGTVHIPAISSVGVETPSGVVAESAGPLRVVDETPAYWRVIFDHPPFKVLDATMFASLQDLLARMEVSPNLRVIVFESANDQFYPSDLDLIGKPGNIMTAVGPSGLPILADTFVRLTRSPVASIAKIRGCVRGASSEFVLACDELDRNARVADA